MKIFTIINQKGGVGKTTLSLFIALYCAQILKKRVLCVDLDPQCNFSNLLLKMELGTLDHGDPKPVVPPVHPDFEPGIDEGDGRSSSADIWFKGTITEYPSRFENIAVVPGHGQALKQVENRDDIKTEILERFRNFLHDPEFEEDYDIIIIDTSPELKPVTLSGLHAASHILIPCVMTELGTQGLAGMLAHYNAENNERLALDEQPVQLVGILANMFRKQGTGHATFYQAIAEAEELSDYLLDNALPQFTAFEYATRINEPSIFDTKPSSRSRSALMSVCEEILERMGDI